jgi:uncharacterized protein (TIGR01777 family)
MVVSISGSSGFIGQALRRAFNEKGWTVNPINRESFRMPDYEFRTSKIEGSEVIINLAGASISKPWSLEYKKEIYESRINSTRKIVSSITDCEHKPRLFISVSAIDIYDEVGSHTEESKAFSQSFLGRLCLDWEAEARKASGEVRLVIPRIGLVLGNDGGALDKMYIPFSIGLGATLGNGEQWMSFIHLKDLVQVFLFIMENEAVSGIVNAVSPYPVTNKEFSSTFGKALKQPVFFNIPSKILRFIYGERAGLLLGSHKVIPEKLTGMGFRFTYPTIQNSLVNLFG